MAKTTHPEGDPMGTSQATEPAAMTETVPIAPDEAPPTEPGTTIANPAEPLAPTTIPEPARPQSFIQQVENFAGYPKRKYHPVHGGIDLQNPNEEAGLLPASDWFDTPEQADAARTWTEAHVASAHNTRAKLGVHDDAGQAIVRNSVQADEAIKRGQAEPL